MGGPAKVERELEEFLPEIRGDRERFLPDEGSDQILSGVLWPGVVALERS